MFSNIAKISSSKICSRHRSHLKCQFFVKVTRSKLVALVRKDFLWKKRYSLSDSHTNTLISDRFAYPSRWRRKRLKGLLFVMPSLLLPLATGCKVETFIALSYYALIANPITPKNPKLFVPHQFFVTFWSKKADKMRNIFVGH